MAYTLITGASSGIGKELAWTAAIRGCKLILVARNGAALRELADKLPTEVIAIAEDLSDADAAERLAAALKRRELTVEILINNAGVADYGEFAETELSRQENMLMLNILTLTKLTHVLLPDIIKRKGRIMNVGSVASFLPGPKMSTYFASKAYVLSFSEALQQELKPKGVSVTCLCPGPTASNFAKSARVGKNHATARTKVSARGVAAFGWNAMQNGKPVAIHGFGNKFAVLLIRFLPRSLVRWAMKQGN